MVTLLLPIMVVLFAVVVGAMCIAHAAGVSLRSIVKVGPMSADARNKLPKAGQICTGCEPMWKNQKLAPKHLVHVFDGEGDPLTTDSGIEIVVCPYCDGDLILRLDKTPDAS